MKEICRTIIAECKNRNYAGKRFSVCFINLVTGAEETRQYKTRSAAKGAITKFERRMIRIYGK